MHFNFQGLASRKFHGDINRSDTKPWPFGQFKLSLCGLCDGMGIFQCPIQNYETADTKSGSNEGNPIQPPGGTDLPVGKLALFGAPLFFAGGWLSGRAIKSDRIGSRVIGWLIALPGGTCLVLALVALLRSMVFNIRCG